MSLCHLRTHFSLPGLWRGGNNIFLCRGIALAVYTGLGKLGARRGGGGGGRVASEVTHVEGMPAPLGSAGAGGRERGPRPPGAAACWTAARGQRGLAPALFMGSHSRQHLLRPHQHPLTPVWQLHSCGVAIGADGSVSASAPSRACNWMSPRPLL